MRWRSEPSGSRPAPSAAYLVTALGFPRGTSARPARACIAFVGAGLCIVAAVFTVKRLRSADGRSRGIPGRDMPGGATQRVVAATAAVFGFCVLLPWIGYVVTTFLFVGSSTGGSVRCDGVA